MAWYRSWSRAPAGSSHVAVERAVRRGLSFSAGKTRFLVTAAIKPQTPLALLFWVILKLGSWWHPSGIIYERFFRAVQRTTVT